MRPTAARLLAALRITEGAPTLERRSDGRKQLLVPRPRASAGSKRGLAAWINPFNSPRRGGRPRRTTLPREAGWGSPGRLGPGRAGRPGVGPRGGSARARRTNQSVGRRLTAHARRIAGPSQAERAARRRAKPAEGPEDPAI